METSSRLLRFGPQALGGVQRRDHNVLIAGAAAQVARNGDADLLFGRVRIVAEEFQERGQHAGRAKTALQAMIFVKRLLQRVQLVGARRDALDGEKVVAVRLHSEHQARPRRAAVHQDGAGAAYAVLAAEMRAGETELVADKIREREADLDFFLVTLAVDRQGDLARLTHVDPYALPVARAYAFSSARRDMTVARCWRYDAGACTSSSASNLRQLSQAWRRKSTLGASPINACSSSAARTGATPMPPSVTDARVIRPAASVCSSTAAETMA